MNRIAVGSLSIAVCLLAAGGVPSLAIDPVPDAPAPAAAPALWTLCPDVTAGPCLGELAAGTYATHSFAMPTTYAVPVGWTNATDLNGELLLLPPGEVVSGVDPGTADYIGIYPDVFPMSQDCSGKPDTTVGRTARALADWMSEIPGIKTSAPPVTTRVGGLDGLYLDVRMDPSRTKGCHGGPGLDLIMGDGRLSDLEHGIGPGLAYRYYFLDGRYPLAIEVGYTPRHESFVQYIDQVAPVIASLRFSSRTIGAPATLPPDGTYRKIVTPDDLIAVGDDPGGAAGNAGTLDMTIHGQDVSLHWGGAHTPLACSGTQSLEEDVVMWHWTDGDCRGDFGYQWAAVGDDLRLTAPDDPGFYTGFIGGLWTKQTAGPAPS